MSCQDPDNPGTGRATCSSGAPTCWARRARATSTSLKHLLGTSHGVHGQGSRRGGRPSQGGRVARGGAGRASSTCWSRLDFRMSTTCVYSDIVLPTATWYEKNDLNTSGHASLHPSADGGGGSVWEAERLGDLQGRSPRTVLACRAGGAGRREGRRPDADHARQPGEIAQATDVRGLEEGRGRADPRQDHAGGHRRRARLSQPTSASRRSGR